MWCELRFAVFNRKVPIYGPYLLHLISKTWEKLYPNVEFEAPVWTCHEPIKLRVKPKWANTTTRAEAAAAQMDVDEDEIEEEEADEEDEGNEEHLDSKPTQSLYIFGPLERCGEKKGWAEP